MGSIQQVAMAAVCLAAAFAFGSYINQAPIDQTTQTDSASPNNLRSLIEPELTVQQIPTNTPLMRPKLKARLPMPSLTHSDAYSNQSFAGAIPPPSDLTGRLKPTQNSLAKSFSTSPIPNGPVADVPSFAPNPSGDSSMPVVNKPNFGSSPNLADSMRAPFQSGNFNEQAPSPGNAPVFAAADFTSKTPPVGQSNSPTRPLTAPVVEKAPTFPILDQRSQSYTAAKPTLPERELSPPPSIASVRETARPTIILEPESASKTATRDQFRYSNPQRLNANDRNQNNLVPIPSLNQTVTIDDPGGAFGNRDSRERDLYDQDTSNRNTRDRDPRSSWANTPQSVLENNDGFKYPEQRQLPQAQPQRRVTRLPLQLNSNAQSKLTRLRNDAIQKISLSTTQFSEYTVKRGDSLQSIANQHFGKPDYYLDIYLANRDRLRSPGDLREGMTIKIPVY